MRSYSSRLLLCACWRKCSGHSNFRRSCKMESMWVAAWVAEALSGIPCSSRDWSECEMGWHGDSTATKPECLHLPEWASKDRPQNARCGFGSYNDVLWLTCCLA